jgi:outer membrane protein assembly complex protein YaeT
MKFLRRTALALGILLALTAAFLLLLHTAYTKKQVASYLQNYFADQYGLKVRIGGLDYTLSPLMLRGTNVRLYCGNGNLFLRSEAVELRLPWRSLWSDHFLIEKIVLTNPSADFDNLPQPRVRSVSGGTFEIGEIAVQNGSLKYGDWSVRSLTLEGRMDSGDAVIRKLDASIEGARITAKGSLRNYAHPQYRFSYAASGDAAVASRVAADLPKMAGAVTLRGTVSGRGADYVAAGRAESPALSLASNAPFSIGIDYEVDSANTKSPYRFDVKWRGMTLETARSLAPSLPQIASVSEGNIRYAGTLDPWKSSGAFRIGLTPNHDSGMPLSGSLSGVLAGGKIGLKDADLTSGKSTVSISGSLNPDTADLRISAVVPSPADLRFLSSGLARVPGGYTFTGSLSGKYTNLKADGLLTGEAPAFSGKVSGQYFLHSERMNLNLEGRVEGKQIDPSIAGTFSFTGTAAGTIERPVVQASLSGRSLQINGIDAGDVTATVHSDGRTVEVDAEVPRYSSLIRGTYALQSQAFTLDGNFTQLSLAVLQPFLPASIEGLTGLVSGQLQAAGNAQHPTDAEATLVLDHTSLTRNGIDMVIESGSKAHLKDRTVAINLHATALDSTLSVNGTVPVADKAGLALQLSGRTDLKNLRLVTNEVEATGEVVFDMEISGSISDPQFSGSIDAAAFDARLRSRAAEFTQASAWARLAKNAVSIEMRGLLNGAPAELSGVIPQGAIPGKLHLSVGDFPLARLAPESVLQGTISVIADAEGTGADLRTWSGTAEIRPANALIADTPLNTGGPIRLELSGQVLQMKPLQIRAANMLDLTASGQFNLTTKQISARVETHSDLSLISKFVPSLQAAGRIDGQMTATGSLPSPELTGNLRIQNGLLRIQDYPFLLERIELEASITKDRIETSRLTASMGGGQITGGGSISLQQGQLGEMSLYAKATNVGTNYPDGFRSQMNADLNLASLGKDYLLQGGIDILRSAYQQNIDPRSRLMSALMTQRKALVPEETITNRIKLQLRVRTVDDVLVENNLARIRAGAQLQITGSVYEPRVSGRMSIRKGSQLIYQNVTYEVKRGDLDFVGKKVLEPEVHLSLTAEVDDATEKGTDQCTIKLNADGPLEDAQLKMDYSDCDGLKSEAAVYSVLLTGEAEILSTGGQRRFLQRQLIGLVAGQIFTGVQQKLASSIGLQFEPQFLITEGDPTAQLTLGKQFSDALHVAYSLSLSQSTEQTWIGEYDIGRNFSMRFVDQSDGSYTGTMNHRLVFGKGFRETAPHVSFNRSAAARIDSITIANDSDLTEPAIRKLINLSPGDPYDFWAARARIDTLKEDFQKRGYLFPSVEIEENGTGSVALVFRISSGGLRKMVFNGVPISDREASQYRRWWRDGFSEAAVLQQITDDLRKNLWDSGYHRAVVEQTTSNPSNEIVYSFDVSAGTKFVKTNVVFQGTVALPEAKLKERLLSFYGGSANEMTVEALHDFPSFKRKLLAIYTEKGFLQTKVRTHATSFDPGASTALVEVGIEEGPRVRIEDVVLSGVDMLPHDLLFSLKLWKGGVYRPLLLPEDETAISDYYEEKGYLQFRMNVDVEKAEAGGGVVLHYNLEPGEVAHASYIRIVGNRNTRRSLIESHLMIKPGDLVTPETLAAAQNRLYDLGVFERVSVQAEEIAVPGQYNLNVDVTERKNLAFAYGYRCDSEQHSEGEAQFTDSNLLGTAQTAMFYGKANSNETLYRFFFQSPFLLGWRWNAFFIGSQDRTQDPFFVTTEFNFQQQTRIGRSLAVVGSIGYKKLHTRIFNPFTGTLKDLYTNIARLRAMFLVDTRDDALNAHRGDFLSTEFELAPSFLKSDLTFVKSYAQFFHYQSFSRMVWASGIRVGLADTLQQELLISSERYFAGGSNTLRGFNINSVGPLNPFTGSYLGGQAVFVFNEELRFPIYRWVGGVVFYDAGNVYPKISDFDLTDIRNSAGFGLRVFLPYGLLGRIDLGFNLAPRQGEDRSVFHFTFGQIF